MVKGLLIGEMVGCCQLAEIMKFIYGKSGMGYFKVKIDGLPIPKGTLVKGQYKIYKPICRDCAM